MLEEAEMERFDADMQMLFLELGSRQRRKLCLLRGCRVRSTAAQYTPPISTLENGGIPGLARESPRRFHEKEERP